MFKVFIWEPQEGFYGCIGEYTDYSEAVQRAMEARNAENDIYKICVTVEEGGEVIREL